MGYTVPSKLSNDHDKQNCFKSTNTIKRKKKKKEKSVSKIGKLTKHVSKIGKLTKIISR